MQGKNTTPLNPTSGVLGFDGTSTVIVPVFSPPFEVNVICPVCVPGDKSCVSIVTVTTSSAVVEPIAGFTISQEGWSQVISHVSVPLPQFVMKKSQVLV
uniref:Uncharacterized protein n=1 Tax=Candidatus Methanophaga sp. ANME-1 ERB7 TaxID=2759913 RepID=A0A7G9Z667_9EURY|nr:hypothetical protein BDFDLMKG_00021 [Methanosarcinales archaeon ANME-1 ERB7]